MLGVSECHSEGRRGQPRWPAIGVWTSVPCLLSAFLGGEMYEQVYRADLPLLPVVFARSGKDLRDGLVIVHIGNRLEDT